MHRILIVFFILWAFFFAPTTLADIVILKSGKTIKNAEVSEVDGTICCETNERTYYLNKASVENIITTGQTKGKTDLPGWVESLGTHSPKTLAFLRNHKTPILYVFFGIVCILGILLIKLSFSKGAAIFRAAKSQETLLQSLQDIDEDEKAVLREFYIEQKNTIELPVDEPVVAGLIERQILKTITKNGQYSIRGLLLPVQINPQIKEHINPAMLGFTDSKAGRRTIMESRPAFIKKIDDYWVTEMQS